MLVEKGVPVTMTSHPGNASLYKLVLWQCGIPEHFWDITCCVADANNWPMFRLRNREAELLLSEGLYEEITRTTHASKRYVTAYQKTKDGERLGRLHVRASQKCSSGVLSSCSRLILSQEKHMREVFGFLADTRPGVLSRFITPEGVMVPIRESGMRMEDLVDSFFNVLYELDHLLWSDEPIETKGGVCYEGIMVPLATMLAQYWQSGRKDRYDISGPDMITYATRPEHQKKLGEMLQYLHAWNPKLIPEHLSVRMFPGTYARIGYIKGHVSESVMRRKLHALRYQKQLNSDQKRRTWEQAKDDERLWPVDILASCEKYFSQHDLLEQQSPIVVDDFWKEISLDRMRDTLVQANALLRVK